MWRALRHCGRSLGEGVERGHRYGSCFLHRMPQKVGLLRRACIKMADNCLKSGKRRTGERVLDNAKRGRRKRNLSAELRDSGLQRGKLHQRRRGREKSSSVPAPWGGGRKIWIFLYRNEGGLRQGLFRGAQENKGEYFSI